MISTARQTAHIMIVSKNPAMSVGENAAAFQ